MEKRLRIWESAALAALCVTLLLGVWAEGENAALRGRLLRLHVLAVSDAPEEQAVKLRVRDAVLEALAPVLEGAADAQEAEARVARSLSRVQEAAESAAGGRRVNVTLSDDRFPTRAYEGFRLPAGRYRTLRVTLGEGKGRNWWCIVFPPVCLAAVQKEELRPAMRPEDYALLTGSEGFELRFRTVELWGELLNLLESKNAAP